MAEWDKEWRLGVGWSTNGVGDVEWLIIKDNKFELSFIQLVSPIFIREIIFLIFKELALAEKYFNHQT